MRKLLIGIGIAIVLIAIILAVVFYLTADATRAGDHFFAMIRDGNIKNAYLSTAKEFRSATSEEQFQAFLKNSSIGDFESSSWSSRSVSNNTGELEGSLKTKGGGVIPIKIKLVKEAGEWKVLAIEKASAGLVSDAPSKSVPAEAELASMTNSSVLLLARAINTRDFGQFHSSISKVWQNQTSPDALKEVFKSFIEQNLDLTVVAGKTAVFGERPSIDDSGRLILKGSYAVQPAVVNFTLKYILEDKQWKLIGINVSMEEAPPSVKGVMPTENQLSEMTNRAVSQLAGAIAKEDFSEFHRSISKRWQAQTSPDELKKAFGVFIEKKISLTVVEGKRPEFTESPKFDNDGVLVLEGQYSTEPFRVLFRLEFQNEESQWKLQGINVRTKNN